MPFFAFYPNSPGDETYIPTQYPDSGEHWDKIDDLAYQQDGDATYVAKSTAGLLRDLYTIDVTQPPNTGPVRYVVLLGYFRAAYAATGTVIVAIKTHGTVYEGITKSFSSSSSYTMLQLGSPLGYIYWYTNPYTGNAWTWNEVESLQIGVSLAKCRCTQLYVGIDCEGIPGVDTSSAFDITEHHATLEGEVWDHGQEFDNPTCECWFEWGKTEAYGSETSKEDKEQNVPFYYTLIGLPPNQEYHFRALANNKYGTGYGEDEIFVTLESTTATKAFFM